HGIQHSHPVTCQKTIQSRNPSIFPLQYNGLVGPEFYSPFTIKAPRFPPNAVIGLSRPLQRGLLHGFLFALGTHRALYFASRPFMKNSDDPVGGFPAALLTF
uniref:Cytochrome b n=1 Tax=Angiostrongylus cantonensis TaxID=6313 RepID=A0A0K0D114_ANGCA